MTDQIIDTLFELNDKFNKLQNDFSGRDAIEFTRSHLEIPVFSVAIYIVIVFQVPHLLSKPLNLRWLNALWNLALSIFSIYGAIVTVPFLVRHVLEHGFLFTVCQDPFKWYNDGTIGFWITMFIYSKIPELLDTVFLVLQKKQVIFLHWFHHITVLLYCWHAFHTVIAPGIWFAAMNYLVHSIMYSYYFVGLVGLRRYFKPIAPLVTTLQLLQMVVGIAVTVTSAHQHYQDPSSCAVDAANLKLGFAMYFSYFVLFALLFQNLYLKKHPEAGADGKKEKRGGVTSTGCPDIATSNNIQDGSGFFHGKSIKEAGEVKPAESKKSK